MPSLSAAMVPRGGRKGVTRECASDPGYGHVNRAVVKDILEEARRDAEYDPLFDYRLDRDKFEPWEQRNKFR